MTRKGAGRGGYAALARRLQHTLVSVCSRESHCALLIVRPVAAAPDDGVGRVAPAPMNVTLVARQVRLLVRETDEVYVDGNNCVVAILPGTRQHGGQIVMKRVADALSGPDVPATTSPGAAGRRPHDTPLRLAIGCGEVARRDLDAPERIALALERAWQPQATIAPFMHLRRMTTPPLASQAMRTPYLPQPRRRITSRPLGGVSSRPLDNARTIPAKRDGIRHRPRLRVIRGGLPPHSEEAARKRAQALGVPFLRLPRRLPHAGWYGISAELAQELRAVPVGCSQRVLTVAMDNPHDTGAVLRLRAATGLTIFPVLALPEELDRALDQIAE
jgi:hypothetical protein